MLKPIAYFVIGVFTGITISGLIKQGMTRFEAIEFYDFNIAGLGHTHAPIIIGQT